MNIGIIVAGDVATKLSASFNTHGHHVMISNNRGKDKAITDLLKIQDK